MSGVFGFVTRRRLLEWAAIVAGFVAVHFVGSVAGWLEWLLLVPSGVLVAMPVILAAQREYLREREAASSADLAAHYRSRLDLTLGDTVIPLAELIDRINAARGERRAHLQAQLVQGTVDAIPALCGGERTRAALFLLDESDQLARAAWAGSSVAPAPPFEGGGQRRIREIMRAHGRVLVEDVNASDAPLRIRSDDAYRSLIVVAITAGGQPRGLLVAHAPEARELGDDDLHVVATLGQLLGAGLAAGPSRLRSGSPRTAGAQRPDAVATAGRWPLR